MRSDRNRPAAAAASLLLISACTSPKAAFQTPRPPAAESKSAAAAARAKNKMKPAPKPKPASKPTGPQAGGAQVPLSQIPAKTELTPVQQKLDQALLEWTSAQKLKGSNGASELSKAKTLPMQGDLVRVKIVGNFEGAAVEKGMSDLAAQIKTLGGEVNTTFANNIYAALSATAVEKLAEMDAVWSIAVVQAAAVPLNGK